MKNCAEKITKVKMRFPIRFDNVSDSFDVVLQYLLLCKIPVLETFNLWLKFHDNLTRLTTYLLR